ncbi:collagen alpha-6(VI) chain-like [Narcine bancroftii]|uniref:collagen alpha-6(VI) chain-like n=1 Tax=Narcine bancroftii TaxID=1343680 RepID=UPI0038316440
MVCLEGVMIVLLFTMGLPLTDSQQNVCRDATIADVVIVVDGSSSIHEKDFKNVKEFLYTFVNGLDIARDRVRIGLVQYSSDPRTEFLLNKYPSKNKVLNYIQNLSQKRGRTDMKAALEFLQSQHFVPSAGSRIAEGVKQIAILVTDGGSSANAAKAAAQLRSRSVTIYVIGVNVQSKKEFHNISSRPSKKYVYDIADFNMLSTFSSTLLESVCQTMVNHIQAFAIHYADVVFLVGNSLNMGTSGFEQIRNFILRTVSQLEIGVDKFQVGLAQYHRFAETKFLLNDFQTNAQVTSYIRNPRKFAIQSRRGQATGSAMDFLGNTFFREAAGSRQAQGVPQIAIIITSESSQDDITFAARALRGKGIKVIAIGVKNFVRSELEKMAFLPNSQFVFQFDDINAFGQSSSQTINTIKRIVQEEFLFREPIHPAACQSAVADVVFLVDGSDAIGPVNFQLLRIFLQNMISALDVKADNVHVGLAQYNGTTTEEFKLKTYQQKGDILDHVRLMPYGGGGRRTGAALDFLRRNYFTAKAGSRVKKGIPQILVLIMSGESQGNVTDSADALRREGVTIYALGVGNAIKSELEKIASYPSSSYVSNVKDFTLLSVIANTLLKKICTEIIKQVSVAAVQEDILEQGCAETEEADIFFLIDGSGSISSMDFKDMKTFLIEIVDMFNIGLDQVRVGIVQYASNAKVEIEINQATNKTVLEREIKSIFQMGGGTKTGSALHYMIELFSEAERSRGHAVPRFLITITDGKSEDDVKTNAAKLMNQKITSYAIGVGQAEVKELKLIGEVYSVTNFDALKYLKNNIVRSICSKEACSRLDQVDIIFLIDGSGSIHPTDFQKMKEFVNNIVNKTNIGAAHVRISVIQFSSDPEIAFKLNEYSVKVELFKAINNIQQKGQGTMTGKALTFSADYFNQANGGRPDVPQYLIVITDGEAQDKVLLPAKAIRDKGVTVFAVGVFQANRTQLLEIGGTQDKVHYIEDFKLLDDLEEQIFWEICSHTETCLKTDGIDIVFAVDGSSNMQPDEFQLMKSFMMTVVNSSTISPSNVQFGAILHNHVQFQLKQFRNKREVLSTIDQMLLAEGSSDMMVALKQAKDLLEPEQGGRRSKGILQYIVLMIAGEDPFLEPLLGDIRQSGVSVLTVRASGNNGEDHLRIGEVNQNDFNIQSFDAMGQLINNITQLICAKSSPECDLQEADIVFLVDGSTSISVADFKVMKSFLKRLINIFPVDPTKVQFGLAQFSSDFQREINLNDFTSKEPLLAKVEEMKKMNGGTNIGQALTISTSLYTKEAGSRKAYGVPQYLLVFTDGESQDPVIGPADNLRYKDTNIFAVGIGQANLMQLLQISGSQENMFFVEKYEDLDKIKRRIIRNLCDKPATACTIDVSVGLDLSNQAEFISRPDSRQKLQMHLEGIIQRMMDLRNISCRSGLSLHTRIELQKSSPSLDLDFKDYQFNAVRKELQLLMKDQMALNADYLLSFSSKFELYSAKHVKIIVMFTDGIDDTMERLKETSERLRVNGGINALIMVPLDETKSAEKLAELEFGRGFGYKGKLRINMPDIGNALLSQIDLVAERECCGIYCKCSGEPGRRGPRGQRGGTGNFGQKGTTGYPGEYGGMGRRGDTGRNGTQGGNGCQGPKGPKGSRGYRGEKGELANNGVDGINGEEGELGIPGVSGEKGADGNSGSKGAQGHKGERGDPGLRGDRGNPGRDNYLRGKKGEKGSRGIQGDFGISGRPGVAGLLGNKGQGGRRGVVGRKGSQGLLGVNGPIGPPGFDGQKGSIGSFGFPGQKGERGRTGFQGRTGREGLAGFKGSEGFKGYKGEAGLKGQKGENGKSGPRGLQGIDGIDGIGLPGQKGRKGALGFPGYPGLQGQDGVQGSPGGRGPKGSRGGRGNSGQPGVAGSPGDEGPPGRKGFKGPMGVATMKPCELLSYIQNHCPCCSARSFECPVYPLDLVFALDMSADVTQGMFNRMKKIVTDFVQELQITDSTCPVGARVAVLTYNSAPKMFIHFLEFRRKQTLLKALQDLAYERSGRRQNIGAAMRFVARNIFKHSRGGILIRKAAVFITSGPSQETSSIMTAALEFSALDITPVVISFSEVPEIQRAFQVDDTRMFQVVLLSRQQQEAREQLRRIHLCMFCFDRCKPNAQCGYIISPPPVSINMDMAFVVDGSHKMRMMDFERVKSFLSSVLDQLVISRSPRIRGKRARIALVQHSPAGYHPWTGRRPVNLEFGFLKYSNKNLMKRYIKESFMKLDGPPGVGYAIEWTMKNVFRSGPDQRRFKVIFVILAGDTSAFDVEKLKTVSREARCKGFVIFTFFLGKETVETDLASFPFEQHSIHLGLVLDSEWTYTQRFARAFLKSLTLEINKYPSPQLQDACQTKREIFITKRDDREETTLEDFEDYVQVEAAANAHPDVEEFEEYLKKTDIERQPNELHDVCSLTMDMGNCRVYRLIWYFNQSLQACHQFWYSGCGGNENRFNSLQECKDTCLKSN